MRSSAVPLGHKLIAVLLAVAVAAGLFVELRRRAAQSAASAVLTFDSGAAQPIDPGILTTPEPAITLAQAILTDQAVAKLLPQAGLPASATSVPEFRSRLEMNQLSAGLLAVQYRDTNPSRGTTVTNAVAETLASWSPVPISTQTPAPTATAPPATTPAPKPTPAAAPKPAPKANTAPAHAPAANTPAPSHALSTALAGLADQLTAAEHRVGGPGEHAGYSPNTGEQQRYLESQFRLTQQKLNDLRTQAATQNSVPDARARIATIRDALLSGWTGGGRAGLTDFHTAGTSAAQLHREKEQLASLIGVVDAERRAVQREEDALAASAGNTPAENPTAQPTPAPTKVAETPAPTHAPETTPNHITETPVPQLAPSEVHPFTGLDNPLRLERLAGAGGPVLWWPAVVAGCLCGLIYFAAVAARYRSLGEMEEYAEASPSSSYRMITPAEPRSAPERTEPERTIPDRTAWDEAVAPPSAEYGSHKRASFRFEDDTPVSPEPYVTAAAEPTAPETMVPHTFASETTPETFPDTIAPEIIPPQSPASDLTEPVVAETEPPAESAPEPAIRSSEITIVEAEPATPFHENVIQIADPWADEVRKALSQTMYGRMMDNSAAREEEVRASGQKTDEGQRPPRSGRRAG